VARKSPLGHAVKTRNFIFLVLSLTALAWTGCSYFRWGEPSYQEIHQRAQDEKAAEPPSFKPGESRNTE
jgi:hypothetical protein